MSGRGPDVAKLERALERRFGAGVRVQALRRLSGGASRETWSFDADAAGRVLPLVLRRDPGAGTGHGSTTRDSEYVLLQRAHEHGVLVPAVELLLQPDDGLGDGFVMRRIEGETIARKILRDDEYALARPLLAAQCGEQAARIHAVPTTPPTGLPVLGAREQVLQYRETIDTLGEPHPAFELGLRWLAEHEPEPAGEPVLVHGDFRNGNLVVGPDGLRAVLDWELAHLGDPVEDLGWFCVKSWRFGAKEPAGGFGSYEDLLGAYESVSGHRIDPGRLRYWEVFGTLKWGVICQVQASLHWSGAVRSVELAALGRRVAEMEWDLLNTLEDLA